MKDKRPYTNTNNNNNKNNNKAKGKGAVLEIKNLVAVKQLFKKIGFELGLKCLQRWRFLQIVGKAVPFSGSSDREGTVVRRLRDL